MNENVTLISFLTGGTALQKLSYDISYNLILNINNKQKNNQINKNSKIVYIITCFDSGGSSAQLRNIISFYPAVGDLRNRICSIAQGKLEGLQFIHEIPTNELLVYLCKYRLPNEKERMMLKFEKEDFIRIMEYFVEYLFKLNPNQSISTTSSELENLPLTTHELFLNLINCVKDVPVELCHSVGGYLQTFLEYIKSLDNKEFNFENASIGNLILTGAYLQNNYNLIAAVNSMSNLLGLSISSTSLVIPSSTDSYTLGAQLQSGEIILGQHEITSEKGAKTSKLSSPIQSLFLIPYPCIPLSSLSTLSTLSSSPILNYPFVCSSNASPEAIISLNNSNIICYSIGSFFTSIIASILPIGIPSAIRLNSKANKVYVPNMIFDTEMIGLSLYDVTTILLKTLYKNDPLHPQLQEQHQQQELQQQQSSLSFIPTDYITHILLDLNNLSNVNNNSLSYSHFKSYEEIIQSKTQIEEEYHIQVIIEDICSPNETNETKIELDSMKFLNILHSLSSSNN